MSRKYAILGETLKHTMSPPIHARLFELKNREYEYEILEVKPEELKDKAEYLNSLNGYNITIPHKIGIIDYTDELDQSAKRYHSVNCVDNKNGRHVGYNTDCDGFLRTVRAMNIDFTGKILLIGCGGVGRMREVCGAMCGAAMVAGMVYGDDTGENREAKSYTYKKVQEIAAEFKKTNPSIICRELLGLSKNCAVTPNAEKRTAEYYKKRPCAQIVEDAVKATEKVLFSD